MNKRIVFLLILLIAVWGVAIYFLFFYGKTTKPSAVAQTYQQILPLRRRLGPEDLKNISQKYNQTVQSVNPFEPYMLNFDKERLNADMLSLIEPLTDYRFAGYAKGENERFVLLSIQGQILKRSPDDVLDGRYLILHVTSFAVAVLDLQTGNLLTIK
ncbi:MAG: hypothetical protein ACK4E2_03685 [Pseudothermotoga sp.]